MVEGFVIDNKVYDIKIIRNCESSVLFLYIVDY